MKTTEEIKKEYNIEFINKEMWVWDNNLENAKKLFVTVKILGNRFPYIVLDKSRSVIIRAFASDTDPNLPAPKEPKPGDIGFFYSSKTVTNSDCVMWGELKEIIREDSFKHINNSTWKYFSHTPPEVIKKEEEFKVGDIGYFWDNGTEDLAESVVLYDEIVQFRTPQYIGGGIFMRKGNEHTQYLHFSKTPPKLTT